jgi:hypothetical protein
MLEDRVKYLAEAVTFPFTTLSEMSLAHPASYPVVTGDEST